VYLPSGKSTRIHAYALDYGEGERITIKPILFGHIHLNIIIFSQKLLGWCDLRNGRYTLVPEGGDEGADKELQYMDVAQGLDQSPEGPKANLASEGKPQIINPSF
jgi:hypothetical protein